MNTTPAPHAPMQPLYAAIALKTGRIVETTRSRVEAETWQTFAIHQRIARLVEAGSPEDVAAKDREIAELRHALRSMMKVEPKVDYAPDNCKRYLAAKELAEKALATTERPTL